MILDVLCSSPAAIALTEDDRRTLESWVAARTTSQRVVFRARIILLAATGASNRRIAREVRTSRPTVILWRQRFLEGGPTALTEDAPGRARNPQLTEAKVKQIVEATLHTTPLAATHWSTRTLACAQGVSPATVQRIWDAHGLQPHRIRTFKLSKDRHFVEKLTDVVGLYLNPPDKALVLAVDEESQIQALDRTQPGLPLKKGRCGTFTHDYKRNGTTTLFAALDVLEGRVIGECMARHRHQEIYESPLGFRQARAEGS
jgi:transposase